MWQQTAAWSVAQVNYEILKLKKFDEFADQFAVSQEAFASNDMQTLIDVLGLDYDEICGVFAKEEDCDVSIAEEAFEAEEEEEEDDEEEDGYEATEAIETIEGEEVAVGSNSIWFSVSLLLAGCYLI